MELTEAVRGANACRRLLGVPEYVPVVEIESKELWVWEQDGEVQHAYYSLPTAKADLSWMFNNPTAFAWEEVDENGHFKSKLLVKIHPIRPDGYETWADTGHRLYRWTPLAAEARVAVRELVAA